MVDNGAMNLANAQNHFIDVLVSLGLVERSKLAGMEGKTEEEIVDFLKKGICTKEQIAKAYSAYFGLPFIHIKDKPIDQQVLRMIPKEDALNFSLICYSSEGNNVGVALGDPKILKVQPPASLSKITAEGKNITLSIVPTDEIDWAIGQYQVSEKNLEAQKNDENLNLSKDASPALKRDGGKYETVDLMHMEIPKEVLYKFPREVASKYKMVVFATEPPISETKNSKKIKVALVNPEDSQAKEILEFIKKRNNIEIFKFQTTEEGVSKALGGYGNQAGTDKKTEEDKKGEEYGAKDGGDDKANAKTEVKTGESGSVAEIKEEEVKKPEIAPEKKAEQMNNVASTVLKSEETRTKEGLPQPYNEAKPEVEAEPVLEVKDEDISTTAGLDSKVDTSDNLEENNLDKFLTRQVNTIDDLHAVIKAGMVPEIVAGIVSLAIVMQVSDIHMEAAAENVRLRYRIDGILKDIIKMPLSLHAPIVSRIKILSKLKIDEQRVPQDGRFDVIVRSHEIDLRVSTLPTVHGEKVVMRILDKSAGLLTLEDMGITGVGFDILVKNIKKPYGIILATGPTGSGKSTTLYAVLQRISTNAVNVITLEDPVEYEIAGINQVQVKPQIGFTFAEGLRSVLRQDPNIVMVGEIRDLETAAMATHAALTGHLVLSTLHTNDAAGALPRLINMGVEPFLITSSVNCIVAQRLVRKVCSKCKEPVELPGGFIEDILKEISKIPDTKIASMKKEDLTFYHGKGCPECTNGYKGRIGIYEVLEMSEKIEELAVDKRPASDIAIQACKDGMVTMKQDGILKALKGITTMDEVLRVTTSD